VESIGPYRVLGKLGEGGMAAVYRVLDPHVQREVALKVIRLDSGESAAAFERFLREAEILARIQHPNVVRVHRLERAAGTAYLVQEIVAGETLEALIRRGPLEPRRAAELIRALADALAAIHREEILHRDLKPANVILRPDGQPVLLDFGIARDLNAERLTQTGAVLGTPSYMAPEQAAGEGPGSLGTFTDVYGLGAILYELLSGQPPFAGSPFSVLKAVLTEDPIWPSALEIDLPPALEGILQVAMAKEGADRYQSVEDLREDLDAFLAGRPTRAGGPASPQRGRLWGGILAGVAALGLAGGGWALSREAAPTQTPTPSSSEPSPTRSERLARDPRLWRLSVGDEMAYVLEFEERGGVAHTYMKGELRIRVTSVKETSARLDMTIDSLRAGLRILQEEPPREMQVSAVDEALFSAGLSQRLTGVLESVKSPVCAEVDLLTGSVSKVQGFDEIGARLIREHRQTLLDIERDVPAPDGQATLQLNILANLQASFTNSYMQRAMDLILSPRSEASPKWFKVGGGKTTFFPRAKSLQPLLGFHLNRSGGEVEVEGRLSYEGGRLVEAQLCEAKPSESPASATWIRWSLRPRE
tara:strand:- start:419 stop:2185 length:1767 start_codon:yes stop_codon:yes gene_type:complete